MQASEQNRGQKIYAWIQARLTEGLTVYASTHLKTIKITPKYSELVRYHNGHCEVARGKHWDSINWTRITAQ